jgi:hypothetical protein
MAERAFAYRELCFVWEDKVGPKQIPRPVSARKDTLRQTSIVLRKLYCISVILRYKIRMSYRIEDAVSNICNFSKFGLAKPRTPTVDWSSETNSSWQEAARFADFFGSRQMPSKVWRNLQRLRAHDN